MYIDNHLMDSICRLVYLALKFSTIAINLQNMTIICNRLDETIKVRTMRHIAAVQQVCWDLTFEMSVISSQTDNFMKHR